MSGKEYIHKPYKQGYTQEDINAALHAIQELGWSARWAVKIHNIPTTHSLTGNKNILNFFYTY